ncbi:hypothetical protein LguiA_007297 [Lonicera macranthoides]
MIARVLESDPKLEPKEDEIGPDLEHRKDEMGVDLVPKVKQEICETTTVQESSAVIDLKVNMVINMYSKYGLDGYACKVFDGMLEMVVVGNMDVLECACEFFSRPEADTNELRTALTEIKQMINWVEGVTVIGYFVLLVFDLGGNKLIIKRSKQGSIVSCHEWDVRALIAV